MSQTLCLDDDGRSHVVSSATLIVRPAAYGILIEGEQVLLQQHENGRFLPPGRILRRHEPPRSALRLVFRATAGITPTIAALLSVETAHYLDPAQQAWQLSRTYYLVERPTTGRLLPLVDDSESRPVWLPVADLTRQSLQFGWHALRLARAQMHPMLPRG